jgi:ferredoxin
MIEEIRAKAADLLRSGEVKCFIGYERASDGLTARPFFAYSADEADRLIFDGTCVHNLARYLPDMRGKRVGILAKPCDSRSINVLIREGQVEREEVYIVGVVCDGVYRTTWGKPSLELQPRCLYCSKRTPVVYDYLIGQPPPAPESRHPASISEVEALERKPAAERWEFWRSHFARCIRCNACRQICPACYCPQCFSDQLDPLWTGIRIGLPQNWVWNVGRALHLAGRCVDCEECQRACPMGIPLAILNRKLASRVKELFGFEAGMDPRAPFPFATFENEEEIL